MKFGKLVSTAFLAVVLFLAVHAANGQLSGSRGGQNHATHPALIRLSADMASSYITVDGVAEIRVKPTEIRVVLAVTAEADSSSECRAKIKTRISLLKQKWMDTGIDNADIVEDFISVLPRFQFDIQTREGVEVAVEKKVGYLMQTNIHLAVRDDAQAMVALNVAFTNGITDIIGFDYWSDQIAQKKREARAAALNEAREKSKEMMAVLFETAPPVINFQEQTAVYYPESLYVSFENSAGGEFRANNFRSRKLPEIRLHRPKNTYYRGLYTNADSPSNSLPMSAEISVVSTVRLYFQSPAANAEKETEE